MPLQSESGPPVPVTPTRSPNKTPPVPSAPRPRVVHTGRSSSQSGEENLAASPRSVSRSPTIPYDPSSVSESAALSRGRSTNIIGSSSSDPSAPRRGRVPLNLASTLEKAVTTMDKPSGEPTPPSSPIARKVCPVRHPFLFAKKNV